MGKSIHLNIFCFFDCNDDESFLAAVLVYCSAIEIQSVGKKELVKRCQYPPELPLKWLWVCQRHTAFSPTSFWIHFSAFMGKKGQHRVCCYRTHNSLCSSLHNVSTAQWWLVICNQIPKIKYLLLYYSFFPEEKLHLNISHTGQNCIVENQTAAYQCTRNILHLEIM